MIPDITRRNRRLNRKLRQLMAPRSAPNPGILAILDAYFYMLIDFKQRELVVCKLMINIERLVFFMPLLYKKITTLGNISSVLSISHLLVRTESRNELHLGLASYLT